MNMMDSYIEFISKIRIGDKIKDFKDENGNMVKFSRVISFNYSKTFEVHYDDYLDKREQLPLEEMFEYAHGKAGNIKETYVSNLVLGCEETLDKENASKKTQCAYFKKYMQRDIKNTARKYVYFYNKKNKFPFRFKRMNNKDRNTAYIFGHTLDVNDGDIIKFVIENNDHIVIFYHTYDDIISKTQNLIKILGKEKYLEVKWKMENRAQLPKSKN